MFIVLLKNEVKSALLGEINLQKYFTVQALRWSMSVWTVIPQDHILIGTKTFSTTRRFLIFFSNYWPDISFSSGRRQAYISLSFHRRLALVGWATLPSPSTTYQEIWCKFSISIIYPSLVSMQRMFDTLTGTCWNTSSITCDPTKRWKLFRRRTKPWTGEEWMTQWMLQHPRDFHQILRRTQIQKTPSNILSIVNILDRNDLKQSFHCLLLVCKVGDVISKLYNH